MSEEKMSVEDCLIKCRELDPQRESLIQAQAAIRERYTLFQKELESLVEEMKLFNTSPQKIQADRSAAGDRLVEATKKYESDILEGRNQILAAREALKEVEQKKV